MKRTSARFSLQCGSFCAQIWFVLFGALSGGHPCAQLRYKNALKLGPTMRPICWAGAQNSGLGISGQSALPAHNQVLKTRSKKANNATKLPACRAKQRIGDQRAKNKKRARFSFAIGPFWAQAGSRFFGLSGGHFSSQLGHEYTLKIRPAMRPSCRAGA